MYLTGEFRDKDRLAAAILALKSEGVREADLDVFSGEPVELRPGVLDRPSRMSAVAVAGGALSGLLLTAGVYWAQHEYPLNTGGMPTFSFWATGVISFEMTMLGAVLCTFAWFLWEGGLLRRDKTASTPRVGPGAICLRVHCEASRVARVQETLRQAGAAVTG